MLQQAVVQDRGASQIQSSIDYIENPEKVGVKIAPSSEMQMGNELASCVMNDIKDGGWFIRGEPGIFQILRMRLRK